MERVESKHDEEGRRKKRKGDRRIWGGAGEFPQDVVHATTHAKTKRQI